MPSLTALKAHLNITGTSNDDELQDMLDAAEEWVSAEIGRPLTTGAYSYAVYSSSGVVVLPTPVTSVTSVTAPDGRTATVRSVNATSGIVFTDSYMCGTYIVAVQLPPVLASVNLAALIVAAHLWETQRGSAPSVLQPADFEPNAGLGFAIPNRARDLLLPHQSPAVA